MATMNVSLPDRMKSWVEERVAAGRYQTASDLVRDLIRREQDRETAIAELQALVTEGIESGVAEDFDPDEFLAEQRAKFRARRGEAA